MSAIRGSPARRLTAAASRFMNGRSSRRSDSSMGWVMAETALFPRRAAGAIAGQILFEIVDALLGVADAAGGECVGIEAAVAADARGFVFAAQVAKTEPGFLRLTQRGRVFQHAGQLA